MKKKLLFPSLLVLGLLPAFSCSDDYRLPETAPQTTDEGAGTRAAVRDFTPNDPLIFIDTPIAFHDRSQVSYGNYNAVSVFPNMCKIPDYPRTSDEDICVAGSGQFGLEYTFTNYNLFDIRFDLSKFSFHWGYCGPYGNGKPQISGIDIRGEYQITGGNTVILREDGWLTFTFTFDNIFRDQNGQVPTLREGEIYGAGGNLRLIYNGTTLYRFVHPELYYDVDDLPGAVLYMGDVNIQYLYKPGYAGYYYRISTGRYAQSPHELFRN